MQIHELKIKNKSKNKKRVGRGGKRGTYSGRGVKGQNARSGSSPRPELRDIIKKYPKKRGYRFKSFKDKPQVINLEDLEKYFKAKEEVTPRTLVEKGLINKEKGRVPIIKILGNGKLTKNLAIKNCLMSKNAKKKLKLNK